MASDSSSGDSDRSSFKFEYELIEDVERLERYRPGGYHPISVGDLLSKYRVIQKLGFGSYSTIWLCQDDQCNKYVALKVGVASSNLREAEVLDFLNSTHTSSSDQPGRMFIPTVLDRFLLRGPNGIHPCYAMAPAMCSVSSAKDASDNGLFRLDTARVMVAQLILAIVYIHDRGIVHGGQFLRRYQH